MRLLFWRLCDHDRISDHMGREGAHPPGDRGRLHIEDQRNLPAIAGEAYFRAETGLVPLRNLFPRVSDGNSPNSL